MCVSSLMSVNVTPVTKSTAPLPCQSGGLPLGFALSPLGCVQLSEQTLEVNLGH